MGPRLGRTTPFSRSQAQISNGNVPPPSSFAAQIADRLLPEKHTSKKQDLDSFRLLLGEILDGNDHVWETNESPGCDAAVNSKLICIIVQAGLRSSSERSTSGSSPDEKEDIFRSFQAIDLILSRSPSALLQPLELDFASGFPLFAWLIPRILYEVGNVEFNESEKRVRDIIYRSLSIAEQAKTRNKSAPLVANYVSGLITDLLPSTEPSENGQHGLFSFNCPSIPSLRTTNARSPAFVDALQHLMSAASHFYAISPEIARSAEFNLDEGPGAQDSCKTLLYAPQQEDDTGADDAPRKRLRLAQVENPIAAGTLDTWMDKTIFQILGIADTVALFDVDPTVSARFSSLDETGQCTLLSCLGQLACYKAIETDSPGTTQERYLAKPSCPECDTDSPPKNQDAWLSETDSNGLMRVLAALTRVPHIQKSGRPRVVAMLAFNRVFNHCREMTHLDITTSTPGQYCLHSLRSSSRDVRIAAGRLLPAFFRHDIEEETLRRNRITVLDYLRSLSERCELALQETCLLAWGQIARKSTEDETNIVLLRLVDYLGHTNPLICGLAYDELQRICNHSSFAALRLFAPYWRTVAPTVVQDLQRRPQVAQYLSDLLSLNVSELLRLTQVYTLPYFVLTKQQDLLQRIANACGQSIKDLCRVQSNMSAILAYIMMRSGGEAEATIMTALQVISSDFVNVNCSELVKSEPVLTATELLKAAGDGDDVARTNAQEALYFLSSLMFGTRHGTPRGTARKSSVIGPFFETHVLGIMTCLSDTVNENRGMQTVTEKIRSLRAVREMIILAKNNVNSALPQISACLRSAIENPELCNEAFVSWMALINTLGTDEILALVEPTFAIIVQYWESFTSRSQTQAHDMISHLLKTQAQSIREVVHAIPSLASIPLMSKFEDEISKFKHQMVTKHQLQALIQRTRHENLTVVERALVELEVFLEQNQSLVHDIAVSEQPETIVSELARTLLDTSVQVSESNDAIVVLCARCIGLLGCLDPTRIEAPREKKEVLVLSNFQELKETVDFVMFFLQEVLVKAFLSATNPRAQGFLAYAMQELLKFCGINNSVFARNQEKHANATYLMWVGLPESVRNILTPFLNSKYVVSTALAQPETTYPIFCPGVGHGQWLRSFTYDLLQKGQGDNVVELFKVLSRVIRTQDTPISTFLLPFAALNVIISGPEPQRRALGKEFLIVLGYPLPEGDPATKYSLVRCSQNIFQVLDYLSKWVQERKKVISVPKASTSRSSSSGDAVDVAAAHIHRVEAVVSMIPAETIARRAVDCKSYARALFYWEQYIREQRSNHGDGESNQDLEPLYERLQQIYTQIDEPDGIEGISSHLQVLDIDQQILEHRKAGRWTAAQSWYELLLNERPEDSNVQYNLLTCLKESGQHGKSLCESQVLRPSLTSPDVLLNQIDGFQISLASPSLSIPFACEASWVTGRWNKLEDYLARATDTLKGNFSVGVARALLALAKGEEDVFAQILDDVRRRTARSLSATNTSSLQACHDILLKLHALTELETIGGLPKPGRLSKKDLLTSLDRRLDLLGAFSSDKQYLLGLRRAAMQLSRFVLTGHLLLVANSVTRDFSDIDVASSWLTSAKLARKAGFIHQSFNAVLHASQLGDNSATIEHSRLLWKEDHHRKAIQSLQGAIAANAFRSHEYLQTEQSVNTANNAKQQEQNIPKARAHLLLAKWVDGAGQTQSDSIVHEYKQAIRWHSRCEKAHYYLGKHYNKLFEYEKARPTAKRAQTFLSGETAKLVIENYVRSLAFGAKYIYQTLPRALTVWLELGADMEQPVEAKHGSPDFWTHTAQQRRKMLSAVNAQIKKYCDRLPAFVFYTAFSQIVARIVHPNPSVYPLLIEMVAKVVGSHAPQALWTLLAVVKSSSKERALRGRQCLDRIHENARRSKNDETAKELKAMISHGQKLSDQLLRVCEGDIQGKQSTISLTKDLGFVHKTAPCRLVVPLESTLTPSLPPGTDGVNMRQHRAFPKDLVTISAFLDPVLVLSSLQRPRKISIRGSNGRVYALLCKPKDDLRKDQRLMEFNTMINRFLKKDAESSKRRLYIKTYAVTPLNEECGLIEWIEGLKTLRDILLSTYKQRNVVINYGELRTLLNEASSSPSKTGIFTDVVLPRFPPVFHEWFVDLFPEPGAWFAARLRYTRSCAVMSIVGHVLGLGDRHGENILFEEGNGGTFHVDFNCLFDKGLTFEKPELVPFRLTHNMVDAFGAYSYEGPFRKSCELALGILRQHEDTLMTILETFLYDPTTDFIGKKKKHAGIVPDTPEGVLESVRNKVRGLLPRESVPLSVEGYTDELIKQATDPERLAAMYIGWCSFF
ncbi:MAG: hypothetical protein Q9208_007662 [Pyrenodesmia sp. 3 TL-2023]